MATSKADVDRILLELAWLEDVEKRADLDCKTDIDFAKTTCDARKVVDVDGERVPIGERRQALEAAALEYCDAHFAELLDGVRGKTCKLTHGKVSWKKSRAALGLTDGTEEDDVVGIVDEYANHEAGLAGNLLRHLQKIKITDKLTAAMLCKVSVKLDRTAVWKAYQAGAINAEDLQAVLLLVVPGEEYVHLAPNKYGCDEDD